MHRLCLAALLFTSCVWLVVGSIESQPYGYRHKQSDNIYYNDESSSRDTRGHNEVNNNPSMIDKVLQTAKSALFPGSNYGRDADNLQYASSHASSEMERGKDAIEEAAKMTRRSGYSSSGYSSGYYGRGGEDCDVNCDSRDVNCKRCDNSDYNRGGSSSGGGLSGFFGFGSGNSGSNNYGRDTANYAKDKMRQGVDSARDTANYGKDKVRQGMDTVRDTATYGSNKLQDAAYYGRDKLQQGADTVKDSIKDTAYYTKDKLQQGADAVRDMSSRAQDRMRDTAYYATDRLADSAERAKDVLKDTYYRAADTAADTAYDWGGRLRDTAASARDTVSDAMSQAAYKAKDLGYIAAVKTADLASSGANTATSGLRFAAARALDVFNRIVRSSAETVGSGAESLRDRLDGDRMQNQRYSDIQLPWSANIGSWTVDEEKEANLELRVAISLMDKARKIMDNIALDCKNKDCRYQEEKLNRAREAERLYQQGIYRVERVLRRRMPREVHISLQEGVQEARDALYESQELIHNITGRGSAYHERPDWHATTRTFFGDDRHLLHTQRSRDEL